MDELAGWEGSGEGGKEDGWEGSERDNRGGGGYEGGAASVETFSFCVRDKNKNEKERLCINKGKTYKI